MSNRSDSRSICKIPFPTSFLGLHKRDSLINFSGILFFVGWWIFLDAVFQSSLQTVEDPNLISVTIADWLPGLCSTFGMILVNLIDKERLGDEEGSSSAYRVRAALFVGFALLAGGVAGGIVSYF